MILVKTDTEAPADHQLQKQYSMNNIRARPTPTVELVAEKAPEPADVKQFEHVPHLTDVHRVNTVDQEVEPDFHARTWVALAAFFVLNYVQVIALQAPSAVVSAVIQ